MELILALREAGGFKHWFRSLDFKGKVAAILAPILSVTFFILIVFALASAAAYSAKDIEVHPTTYIMMRARGTQAQLAEIGGMGNFDANDDVQQFVSTARTVRKRGLLDYPSLPIEELKRAETLSFVLRGQVHFYRIAAFVKASSNHLVLYGQDGTEIRITKGVVRVKRPYEADEMVVDQADYGTFVVDREL